MASILRRWSLILLLLALVLFYNQRVTLPQDEFDSLVAPYRETHFINDLYARRYKPDQLYVTIAVTRLPLGQNPAEKVNLVYHRSEGILEESIEGYYTKPLDFATQFILVAVISSLWLLYIDPLLAGNACPECRAFGIFPRLLESKERTLFASVLSDDGITYWPEIIEEERACPSCSFREYSVREGVVSKHGMMDASDLTEAVSFKLEQKLNGKRKYYRGLTLDEYRSRLQEMKESAAQRSSPRT